MKYTNSLKALLLFLCLTLVSLSFFIGTGTTGQNKLTTGEKDMKTGESFIISLDFLGGQVQRKDNTPHLMIDADGVVKIGAPYDISKSIQSSIPLTEVKNILRFAIDQNHFFEFDAKSVKERIADANKENNRFFAVADAATTVIRIISDGKDHTVTYYALAHSAERYPDIKELQQLLAIQKRLQHLMSVERAGGEDSLAVYLDDINRQAQQKWPGTALFTTSDLQFANHYKNGKKQIQFVLKTDETKSAAIYHSPGQKPRYELIDR